MKPSLLMILFLAGTVYSRGIWDAFNAFFGNKGDSDDENMIPGNDETSRMERKPVDNRADDMNNNEIVLKDPFTHKKWNYTHNRVGWLYSIKGDITTEQGYKEVLQELSEYLGNLTGIQRGPNYIYEEAIDFEEDNEVDDFEWYPHHSDDSDYWDDYGPDHDELK